MRKIIPTDLGLKMPGRRIRRLGFTLIELLVVMTIIGILVGLVTVAVFAAMRHVRSVQHYIELGKLAQAMDLFSEKFGSQNYPPDGSGDSQRIKRFVKIAFPNRRRDSAQVKSDLDPATSLVYWLSQISTDTNDPFKQVSGGQGGQGGQNSDGTQNRHLFMKFDQSRLRNGMYYPPGSEPGHAPIVYFLAATYNRANYSYQGGTFKPYYFASSGQSGSSSSGGREFAEPLKYQIISCGLDGRLGTGGQLISDDSTSGGSSISLDDEDNSVHFDGRNVGNIRK